MNREKEKEEERRYLNHRRILPSKTLIAGDDDDFGEVKMVKVLAGRRKVRDVFDVFE